MNGELKLGMQVVVYSAAGDVLDRGVLTAGIPAMDGTKGSRGMDFQYLEVNHQKWYLDQQVECAVCGSAGGISNCPQCGLESVGLAPHLMYG